jgi:hypothetical protein
MNFESTLMAAIPESVMCWQDVGEFDAVSEGQWANLGGGAQLWGATISSPGAHSQMILFR